MSLPVSKLTRFWASDLAENQSKYYNAEVVLHSVAIGEIGIRDATIARLRGLLAQCQKEASRLHLTLSDELLEAIQAELAE